MNEMIGEAVKFCQDAGWQVVHVSSHGSHYLKRATELHLDRGIRVSDHKRFMKSKGRRKRWFSINVACHGWRDHLAKALAMNEEQESK